MLHRMQARGERIVVRLTMEARTLPDVRSRNVVAELRGRERPEEVVVIGGHIDSWDVGRGAMDDAGGVVAAWEAVRLMRALGLRPRRTVRVVGWTNEENGLRGGNAYRDAHRAELDDHVLAIESDAGVFRPQGFGFTGSDSAFALVREVAKLLEPIGAGRITRGGGGADIGPIMQLGVPGMGLSVDGTRYFWYHHTDADTVDKLDPNEVALCVATMAVMAYVVAEMPERLPRAPVGAGQ
jgi:carboxypeptidase Q